MRVITVQ